MALRFRLLPSDDTSPAGQSPVGPLVARDIAVPAELNEIRVGRHNTADLHLPFALVAPRHVRISRAPSRAAGAGWLVEDLGSANGTRLDGALLRVGERRPLTPGAELLVGNVRLRFEGEGPAAPAGGTATIARQLVDDLFGGGAAAPTLRVARGAPPAELPLAVPGRTYIAGRGEGCALRLPVEEVSREHAAFSRGDGGVVVGDLGSKNGVVIAGARITGERALADGDAIQIGPVLLTLDDPVTRYLRELEHLPPEPPAPRLEPAPLPAPVAPAEPAPAAPAVVAAPAGSAPAHKTVGATQLVVGVAVSVLLLLAVAAGVLVFARG
jgi:pSer/pThr/pTyr-binding forkhead associated (FHA) protein